MEIEWLERNELPVELIYPDYQPKVFQNMYNLPEKSLQEEKEERRKKRANKFTKFKAIPKKKK